MATVEIILDAQYGSCGKGAFAQWLAGQYDHRPDLAIRTGGPNAGHSVILPDGRRFALRHVPAAAVSARHAALAIPPAGLINPDVLLKEVAELDAAGFDVSSRLMIDPLATVIEHEHEALESAGGLREKVGSTREGVGAAQAAKIMRHAKTAADHTALAPFLAPVFDEVWRHVEDSSRIHIEMTQGMGLSLHYGHYPYATSRDISPAQAFNDCGLSPSDRRLNVRTYLLARTFPIRVAGNSGPFGAPGHPTQELSWDDFPTIQPEKTTVTGLTRRIAQWSSDEVLRSAQWARPTDGVLMFADYLYPEEARHAREQVDGLALFRLTMELWDAGAFDRYREPYLEVGADITAISWGFGFIERTPAWF